jgi:hypothetical protein
VQLFTSSHPHNASGRTDAAVAAVEVLFRPVNSPVRQGNQNGEQKNKKKDVNSLCRSDDWGTAGATPPADGAVLVATAPSSYVPDRALLLFCSLLEEALTATGSGWTQPPADGQQGGSDTATSAKSLLCFTRKFKFGVVEFISLGSDRHRMLQVVVDQVAADALPPFLTFLQRFDATEPSAPADSQKTASTDTPLLQLAPSSLYPSPLLLSPRKFSIDAIRRPSREDEKLLTSEISDLFHAHARHLFVIGESYHVVAELTAYARARGLSSDHVVDVSEEQRGVADIEEKGTAHATPSTRQPSSCIMSYLQHMNAVSSSSSSLLNGAGGGSAELLWLTNRAFAVTKLFVIVVVVVARPGDGAHDSTILAVLEMKSC